MNPTALDDEIELVTAPERSNGPPGWRCPRGSPLAMNARRRYRSSLPSPARPFSSFPIGAPLRRS